MPDPSKIHPGLAERIRVSSMAPTARMIPIIIRYRQARLGVTDNVEGVGLPKRMFRLIPAASNSATPAGIEALSDRDDIEVIWYDAPVHTMLDVSVSLVGAPQVWQEGVTGKGIKVGVVDTGVDPGHPDLILRVAQVKDLTGEGPLDVHGHGTHVAGIIGSSGAASNGIYRGVAWECSLYVAKVLGANGSGSTSDTMAGIEWAVQQGVQIINLSLGTDGACDGTDALSAMCDAVTGRGIVVCAAAGNAGPIQRTVGSPGCARDVITVAATDKEDQMASFSSRGPTSDGRQKPDISFPGVNIISCRAQGTSLGSPIDDYYTRASGTSMATPHATGACALLLQANPDLSPKQIKELLCKSAKNLGLDESAQGSGRADIHAAIVSSKAEIPRVKPPQPASPPGPTAPSPPASGCLGILRNVVLGR